MTSKRGDVVLVLFPDSNLRTAKRRPALVVQATALGTGLPQTIVAMTTSNVSQGWVIPVACMFPWHPMKADNAASAPIRSS